MRIHRIILAGLPRKLTDEQVLSMGIDYESGMDVNLICEKYDISLATVHKYLRDLGGISRRKKIDQDAVAEDYLAGLPLTEISSKHNVSVTYISRLVQRRGLPQRNRWLSQEEVSSISQDVMDGMSTADICTKYDISPVTVKNRCEQMGIGVPTSRHRRVPLETQKEIAEAVANGESAMSVSRRMGVAYNTVCRILDFFGIERDSGIPRDMPEGEKWESFLQRYRAGEGAVRLCNELRLQYHAVRKKLIEMGEFRAGKSSLSPKQVEFALQQFDSGNINVAEIANEMSVSKFKLYYIFDIYQRQREHHQRNLPGLVVSEFIPKSEYPNIQKLYDEGYNVNAIALLYDVSRGTIQALLHDMKQLPDAHISSSCGWYRRAQYSKYDWEKASQEYLADYAGSYENDNQAAPDPGAGVSEEFTWTYYPTFPIKRFADEMDPESWITWFDEECQYHADDGRPDQYTDILTENINEPVIAVDLGHKMAIWDGYHRVGASFKKGAETIPAVVGVRI